jgi:large subunit ribosomal protein L2
MALKQYNPVTPGQRQLVTVDRSGLWKGKPVKTLSVSNMTPTARPSSR